MPVVDKALARAARAAWGSLRAGPVIAVALLLAVIVGAFGVGERRQGDAVQVLGGRRPMVVYFGDDQASGLVGERRWVAPADKTPRRALEALLAGPRSPALVPAVPAGVQILGLEVEDGIARVDFSRGMQADHPGGSAGELLTVYGVVLTLTEFPEIQRVLITVEGRRLESLAGHVSLDEPIAPDRRLVLEVREAPLTPRDE